jgi:hypothetical protein
MVSQVRAKLERRGGKEETSWGGGATAWLASTDLLDWDERRWDGERRMGLRAGLGMTPPEGKPLASAG